MDHLVLCQEKDERYRLKKDREPQLMLHLFAWVASNGSVDHGQIGGDIMTGVEFAA